MRGREAPTHAGNFFLLHVWSSLRRAAWGDEQECKIPANEAARTPRHKRLLPHTSEASIVSSLIIARFPTGDNELPGSDHLGPPTRKQGGGGPVLRRILCRFVSNPGGGGARKSKVGSLELGRSCWLIERQHFTSPRSSAVPSLANKPHRDGAADLGDGGVFCRPRCWALALRRLALLPRPTAAARRRGRRGLLGRGRGRACGGEAEAQHQSASRASRWASRASRASQPLSRTWRCGWPRPREGSREGRRRESAARDCAARC